MEQCNVSLLLTQMKFECMSAATESIFGSQHPEDKEKKQQNATRERVFMSLFEKEHMPNSVPFLWPEVTVKFNCK